MRIIAGTYRGRRIEAPEGMDTRPTLDRVRENLFNMLQGRIRETRVLDLFAGSGALSLEALSRGAAFAVMADRDPKAVRTEKKNIAALGAENRTRVIHSAWQETAARLRAEGEKFELIFLDPPYALTDLREVTAAVMPLMDADCLLIVEHEAKSEIQVSEGLQLVKERTWGYCGVKIYEQLRDSGIL